jgi:hypothetical protein
MIGKVAEPSVGITAKVLVGVLPEIRVPRLEALHFYNRRPLDCSVAALPSAIQFQIRMIPPRCSVHLIMIKCLPAEPSQQWLHKYGGGIQLKRTLAYKAIS